MEESASRSAESKESPGFRKTGPGFRGVCTERLGHFGLRMLCLDAAGMAINWIFLDCPHSICGAERPQILWGSTCDYRFVARFWSLLLPSEQSLGRRYQLVCFFLPFYEAFWRIRIVFVQRFDFTHEPRRVSQPSEHGKFA